MVYYHKVIFIPLNFITIKNQKEHKTLEMAEITKIMAVALFKIMLLKLVYRDASKFIRHGQAFKGMKIHVH